MPSAWAPPEHQPDPEDLEDALLRAISDLQARLTTLRPDDFAGRYAIEKQVDEFRSRLHELQADALEEASDEWAERAGRKGEHEQNVDALEALARTMTPETS